MKSVSFIKKAVCFSVILITVLLSVFSAFAVDADGDGIDDGTSAFEPIETEPIYTEPDFTEPPAEETTEYVPETTPAEEATQATAPIETEPIWQDTQPPSQEYVGQEEQLTLPPAPTVPKTVSEKKYSTNYTAGVLSWICVGAGTIVVAAVLVSTKISGRKTSKRRI